MQINTATIIGSTGMTGSALLQLLLTDNSISTLRLIVRKAVEKPADNVEIKLINFEDEGAFKASVSGSDVVFCCIGTTQKNVQGDKQLYRKIDFDIPVNAAKYCKETGCKKMVIISAVGANAGSNNFYLRLKGEMEAAVKSSGIEAIHIFQPSVLLGSRKEKRPAEAVFQGIIKRLSFLLIGRLQQYWGIAADDVARAMIAASKKDVVGCFTYQYNQIMELAKQ